MSMRKTRKVNRLQIDTLEPRVCLSAMGQAIPHDINAPSEYIDPSEVNYLPSWQIGTDQQQQTQLETAPSPSDPIWAPADDQGLAPSTPEQIDDSQNVDPFQPSNQSGLYPSVTQEESQVQDVMPVAQGLPTDQSELDSNVEPTQSGFYPAVTQEQSQEVLIEDQGQLNDQSGLYPSVTQDQSGLYPSVTQDQSGLYPSVTQEQSQDLPVGFSTEMPMIVDDTLHDIAESIQTPQELPSVVNNDLFVSDELSPTAPTFAAPHPFFGQGF
jgi:hypothetical protein